MKMNVNDRKKLADSLVQNIEKELAQDDRLKGYTVQRDIDHTRNKIRINIQFKETK